VPLRLFWCLSSYQEPPHPSLHFDIQRRIGGVALVAEHPEPHSLINASHLRSSSFRPHSIMATRKRPMKVIVGGMPRTSTVSITSALRELGFTPYDYFTRLEKGDLPQWNRMLKAKYQGSQQALDREQLDRLTGDYDVSATKPACSTLSRGKGQC
jgi:Sulfotransferase domain